MDWKLRQRIAARKNSLEKAHRERAYRDLQAGKAASDKQNKKLELEKEEAKKRAGEEAAKALVEITRLEEQAETDTLTDLPNRRSFKSHAPSTFSTAKRNGKFIAVVMMDIDHFKKINDAYGHPVGDEALIHFAQTIFSAIRPDDGDQLYRVGGEEFLCLANFDSKEDAENFSERLRKTIEQSTCISKNGITIKMTASFGMALAIPVKGCHAESVTLDAMAEKADEALYVAKKSGRNRVELTDVSYEPVAHVPERRRPVKSAFENVRK